MADNKKVIITGANSGIGFECASLVLKLNGKLVMACRNKQRALEAKEKLNSLYPDKEIDIRMDVFFLYPERCVPCGNVMRTACVMRPSDVMCACGA